MIVAAHQPLFIPWIGYFNKISRSDLFVIVDNVQFTTSGWIRRNSIKGPGGLQKLIVPIKGKKSLGQLIRDVLIDNKGNPMWRQKHVKALELNYRKAAFFPEVMTSLERIYSEKWDYLAEFNIALMEFVCKYLEIPTPLVKSSDKRIEGGKTELIVDICEKTGADIFMLGMGGSVAYADAQFIRSKGFELVTQDFIHPTYTQLFGDFVPRLSVLDILFNVGPESATIVKRSCGTGDLPRS